MTVVRRIDNVKKVMRAFRDMRGAEVGYLAETTGGQTYDNGLTLAHNALIHEIGVPQRNIPSRPFMTQGADAILQNPDEIARVLMEAIGGSMTGKTGSRQIGSIFVKNIQAAILRGNFTPLRAATKKRKGSSSPLQDTGALKQGVDSRAK